MWNECLRRKDECDCVNRFPLSLKDSKPGAFLSVLSESVVTGDRHVAKKSLALLAAAAAAAASALARKAPASAWHREQSYPSGDGVLVYGTAALIVGAGLIGALRRR